MLKIKTLLFAIASIAWMMMSAETNNTNKSFKLPDFRDVVLYQVNIRSFSKTHDFKGIAYRLDSIKKLGVNVIYLMPVYPVGQIKSVNSPYCIRDYKLINPEFGSLKDLQNLIQLAHNKGIAVILDWVANHTSWDNPWVLNKSWYKQNSSGEIVSPKGYNDVAQLNFENDNMRKAMICSMKYWIDTANCDGFRCDYADGVPADFWKQAIDSLRKNTNRKLLMFAEGQRADHFTSGFDYIFGFKFYEQLKRIYKENQSVSAIDSISALEYSGSSKLNRVVRYTSNHDVNSSDGVPEKLFGGKSGSIAAFIIASYMEGIPMIYNGQEIGYSKQIVFPFTSSVINWNESPDITNEYKKIIGFYNKSQLLRRGELTYYKDPDICTFTKSIGTDKILVLVNIRNKSINYSLPLDIAEKPFIDVFTNKTVQLGNRISLKPYEYIVLKSIEK